MILSESFAKKQRSMFVHIKGCIFKESGTTYSTCCNNLENLKAITLVGDKIFLVCLTLNAWAAKYLHEIEINIPHRSTTRNANITHFMLKCVRNVPFPCISVFPGFPNHDSGPTFPHPLQVTKEDKVFSLFSAEWPACPFISLFPLSNRLYWRPMKGRVARWLSKLRRHFVHNLLCYIVFCVKKIT